MKRTYFILTLLTAVFWYSCTEETKKFYVDEGAPAPAQISDVQVAARPGGALLTYKIPQDPNLLYVKAVYEIQPGVLREARSSIFTDTLKLVGFGDILTHEVKIFSVGKNEKASEPISVSVTPEAPPVQTVFASTDLTATFGGINVSFTNPNKADLSIVILADSTGNNTWAPVTTYYTSAISGNFSARGMESVEKRFALFIRDRWNNKSDTLFKLLTPKFETEIPKTTWKPLVLPTDQVAIAAATYPITKLWDGLYALANSYASANASVLPQWITIDLGVTVQLSRFKEHQAATSHLYIGSALLTFELWGSTSPDVDGGWTKWILLGTFHSIKPSGTPYGTVTAEDKNYGSFLGEDFSFDIPPAPLRYLRLKSLETYGSTGQVVCSELDLFGEVLP